MGFALIWAVGVAVLVLMLIVLGRRSPLGPADFLDWKPTRSYEDEVELELQDIDQMLEAQNERRRRSGRPELSEDEVRAQVDAAQRELQERATAYRSSSGSSEPGA